MDAHSPFIPCCVSQAGQFSPVTFECARPCFLNQVPPNALLPPLPKLVDTLGALGGFPKSWGIPKIDGLWRKILLNSGKNCRGFICGLIQSRIHFCHI